MRARGGERAGTTLVKARDRHRPTRSLFPYGSVFMAASHLSEYTSLVCFVLSS